VGNIDRYPTYKGGKVTEVVVHANYIGLRRFYQYVVNIGRWSPYEGGQLDRFHCIFKHNGDALLKKSFALSALYICLLMCNISYQSLNKNKSFNKPKHLHIASPYFSDLEHSMAVSLLYSQCLQTFPYKSMENKWQVGVLSLTAMLKALVHD